MENIKPTENTVQAEETIVDPQGNIIRRVRNFTDYAFRKAGLNNGDSYSLLTHLNWIKDGHLIDEGFNAQDHLLRKKKIEGQIDEKVDEKTRVEFETETATNVLRPDLEFKIKETESEIQQVKIDLANNKLETGYQSIRFWAYTILTILLTAYLIFFYASSIYSAFFRNPQSLIANAGNDIAMLLDSIFDPKGIFTPSSALIFTYLGAFIFFSIGMAPHSILNDKEDKYRKIKASLVIIGAFIADAALAYKIDKGLHDLKIMAGMPDLEWNFYTSINFYLVLLFGFAAYLVWGFTFEMMINEKIKKSKEIKASILIKGLKKQISELKENIVKLDEKIKLLEGQIQILKQQIEKLKRNLESAMQNPDELSRNLTSFYLGWRQFLNGSSEFDEIKIECENTYNNFISNAFSTTTK
jgi:hypothetical protein